MTQQDDITQRVLTGDEINDLCGWRSSNTTMRAKNDRALAREVETAVLSKLRAPVARELPGWEQISAKEKRGEALTPLELFIYDNEPAGDEDTWRDQLAAALASAPAHGDAIDTSPKRVDETANDRHEASAPVAGEQIIAWDVQDTGLGRRYTTYNPKVAEDLMNLGENVRPLVYASALPPANPAPQASALAEEYTRGRADGFDAGQSAALEKAAAALEDHRKAGREWVPGSLWDTLSREAAARIRALKQPQAITDLVTHGISVERIAPADFLAGGQQRAGDVDERAAFEAWAYRAGMGPKFRESMFAAWEARAALSAPQAEQGERKDG